MEMNNLVQGDLTGDEYVEKVQDIYARLGDEYALSLATRFIDGINDRMVQLQVDGQLRGVYTPFREVIQVYLGCTASLRRREVAISTKKPQPGSESQGYEQVIRQMGEMFKDILSRPMDTNHRQTGANQPIYQPVPNTMNPGNTSIQPPRFIPYQQGQREYRSRGDMTCFQYGEKRHRAQDCINAPLSKDEQDRLRNDFLRSGSSSRYPQSNTLPPQVVAHVDVSREMDGTDPAGVVTISANLVEVFNEEEKDELKRLKDKVAYLEAAMAEKRGRTGDTTVSEEPTSQRRRSGRSISPGRSRSQPQTARVRSPLVTRPRYEHIPSKEQRPMTDDIPPVQEGQPFVPDPYFADPALYSRFVPTATVPKTRKKRSPPKPKRHIKMMQGLNEWNPVEMLRNIQVTGLDLPNLMNISPTVRMAIAKALQLEPDATKRKKPRAKGPSGRVVDLLEELDTYAVSGVRDQLKGVIHGVLPEPKIKFFNFHTDGEIITYPSQGRERKKCYLDKILIDGGAVVNSMPEEVAKKLGLSLTDNNDILIRTATNEVRSVKYCTTCDVCIAGVTATITVYVLDIPQSYSLLLGRRWLYQVRAIGDYAAHSYTIYDASREPHQMSSTVRVGSKRGPDVMVNPEVKPRPGGDLGLTEQEKEEIEGQERMQALIDKLTKEAHAQLKEYEEEYGDDEEEEDSEDSENGDVFVYPGSEDDTPKVQQQ